MWPSRGAGGRRGGVKVEVSRRDMMMLAVCSIGLVVEEAPHYSGREVVSSSCLGVPCTVA